LEIISLSRGNNSRKILKKIDGVADLLGRRCNSLLINILEDIDSSARIGIRFANVIGERKKEGMRIG